jgi:hypothetical protein
LDFLLFRIFPILQVREKKRLKKISKKVKNFLDKILFCDRVMFIEKCAPTQSGRFAFMARLFPRLPAPDS